MPILLSVSFSNLKINDNSRNEILLIRDDQFFLDALFLFKFKKEYKAL